MPRTTCPRPRHTRAVPQANQRQAPGGRGSVGSPEPPESSCRLSSEQNPFSPTSDPLIANLPRTPWESRELQVLDHCFQRHHHHHHHTPGQGKQVAFPGMGCGWYLIIGRVARKRRGCYEQEDSLMAKETLCGQLLCPQPGRVVVVGGALSDCRGHLGIIAAK